MILALGYSGTTSVIFFVSFFYNLRSNCFISTCSFSASNVHCQGSTCCRGCGQQEWFYGCADISIKPSAGASNQNYFHFGNQNMQGPLTTLFKRQPTERTPIYPNNFPDSFVPINVGGPYDSGKGSLPQNIIPFGVNRQANRKPQS